MLLDSNLYQLFFLESNQEIKANVNSNLKNYLINKVLPQYNKLDSYHNIAHAYLVMLDSIKIALEINKTAKQPLDLNVVITAAAYHDIGRLENEKKHNVYSNKILLEDSNLREWLNDEEIILAADACLNHCDYNPKNTTIYSKVLYDADKLNKFRATKLIEKAWNNHFKDIYKDQQTFMDMFLYLRKKHKQEDYPKLYLKPSLTLANDELKITNQVFNEKEPILYQNIINSMLKEKIIEFNQTFLQRFIKKGKQNIKDTLNLNVKIGDHEIPAVPLYFALQGFQQPNGATHGIHHHVHVI